MPATGYGVICTIEELLDRGFTWNEVHRLFAEAPTAEAAVERGFEYIMRHAEGHAEDAEA